MIKKKYSLKHLNTFKLDVNCELYFSFEKEEDLILYLKENSIKNKYLILGGGSNILFSKNFEGIVFQSKVKNINVVKEDVNTVYVEAGSGIIWDDFVDFCVRKKYFGLENLSLIPGCVGAAPVQNIGAYGTEVESFIEEVRGVNLETNKKVSFCHKECRFSYRNSIFKTEGYKNIIITSVVFKLSKIKLVKKNINEYEGNRLTKYRKYVFNLIKDFLKAIKTLRFNKKRKTIGIEYRYLKRLLENSGFLSSSKIRETIIKKRMSKLPDPEKVGNVGSFFKNAIITKDKGVALKEEYPDIVLYPVDSSFVKVSSGWLISKCGWKQRENDKVGFYKDQTLVIINKGSATGEEIYEYSERIVESVQEKFGINLEREVVVV